MKNVLSGFLAVLFIASLVSAMVGGGDIVYKVKKVGDVTFSHDSHVTDKGFKCEDCHPAIFPQEKGAKKHKMADMRKKQACGVCHNGKNAFDVGDNCYICHKSQ